LLHNFSPYFTLTHAKLELRLTTSQIGDTMLSDDVFFEDLKAAATKFPNEVENDSGRPDVINACLSDVCNGGAIYYKDGKAKEFSKTSSRPQGSPSRRPTAKQSRRIFVIT
jgi:hypothetical protein